MNTRRFVTILILVLGLLLTLSVGLSAARDAQDDPPPLDPVSVDAVPVKNMLSVQGRLTNAGGSPLSGDYNLTFRVYDDDSGGNLLCEDTLLVTVDNGLFNTAIDDCRPSDIYGYQLYLSVEVESDGEMTPRQPLYPVPYAYSLVWGGRLKGSLGGQPMYTFETSSGDYATAVKGYASATSGQNFGVEGVSKSGNGYGGYFENTNSGGVALKAAGSGKIQSSAQTYLFVPGANFIKNNSGDTTEWQIEGATARIASGTSGTVVRYIRIPITIPAVLYGQPVRVTQIKVYYRCPNSDTWITETRFTKNTDADSNVGLISTSDGDLNRTSTIATSYTIDTISPANLLSADQGFLTLRLGMRWIADGPEMYIGGVRLTLEHD